MTKKKKTGKNNNAEVMRQTKLDKHCIIWSDTPQKDLGYTKVREITVVPIGSLSVTDGLRVGSFTKVIKRYITKGLYFSNTQQLKKSKWRSVIQLRKSETFDS